MASRPNSSACSCRTAAARESHLSVEQEPFSTLQHLATIAGIPTPQLHIIEDAHPGAFAIGGGPFRARIIISTGLRSLLTVEELTAALAHEIAHIKRCHSLLMTATNAIAAIFVLAGGLIALLGHSLRRQGGIFLTAVGMAMTFAALLCRDAVARHCEFEADRLGGSLCGHPERLVSALRKVSALYTSESGRIISQRWRTLSINDGERRCQHRRAEGQRREVMVRR